MALPDQNEVLQRLWTFAKGSITLWLGKRNLSFDPQLYELCHYGLYCQIFLCALCLESLVNSPGQVNTHSASVSAPLFHAVTLAQRRLLCQALSSFPAYALDRFPAFVL